MKRKDITKRLALTMVMLGLAIGGLTGCGSSPPLVGYQDPVTLAAAVQQDAEGAMADSTSVYYSPGTKITVACEEKDGMDNFLVCNFDTGDVYVFGPAYGFDISQDGSTYKQNH